MHRGRKRITTIRAEWHKLGSNASLAKALSGIWPSCVPFCTGGRDRFSISPARESTLHEAKRKMNMIYIVREKILEPTSSIPPQVSNLSLVSGHVKWSRYVLGIAMFCSYSIFVVAETWFIFFSSYIPLQRKCWNICFSSHFQRKCWNISFSSHLVNLWNSDWNFVFHISIWYYQY